MHEAGRKRVRRNDIIGARILRVQTLAKKHPCGRRETRRLCKDSRRAMNRWRSSAQSAWSCVQTRRLSLVAAETRSRQ